MRPEADILADARDTPPFSNGTEGYGWMENWCWRPCMNPVEKAWRDYEDGKRKNPMKGYAGGCPLIMCALIGKTPVEWLDNWDGEGPYPIGGRFTCTEFIPPDEGGGRGDPRPPGPPRAKREPKDMDGLFPRPPRQLRMLLPYTGRDLSVPREMVPA